jgi:hypothetical protein
VRAPVVALGACIALVLAAAPARAEPDPGVAVVVGAATMLAGFAVGATVTATASGSNAPTNSGWLIMESGFVLAPWTAHATQGQWTRGLAFSALPAATVGGTVGLFEYDPGTVLHGTLVRQRILWGLFGAGLVSSVIGVLDVTLARPGVGPIALAPMVAPGGAGLEMGGTL